MSDTFDQAQEREAIENATAVRIQQARAAKHEEPSPTGECMNPLCGEPVESPKLFCNSRCAQEHARRVK
jgi:hypothetical protein